MIPWKDTLNEQICFYVMPDSTKLALAADRIIDSVYHQNTRPEPYDVRTDRFNQLWISSSDASLQSIRDIDLDYINKHPISVFEFCGDYVVLDGKHRYLKAYVLGLKSILARHMPIRVWQKYIIEIDDEFLAKYDHLRDLPGWIK